MGKRKRFNAAAIASSNNYVASRRAHRLALEINHQEHLDLFIEVQQQEVKGIHYTQVKIFGKWIDLGGKDPKSFKGFELR